MRSRKNKHHVTIFGAWLFLAFGCLLALIGGYFSLRELIFGYESRQVSAEITASGTFSRSQGIDTDYIRYRFLDTSGQEQHGESTGYRGDIGESVLVEYSPPLPWVHRVAGEGSRLAYRWCWLIFGAGLLFVLAGWHWQHHTLQRLRLLESLRRNGLRANGTVRRQADGLRTLEYDFSVAGRNYSGKTLPLPSETVRQFESGASVEVLYQRAHPDRNALSVEL